MPLLYVTSNPIKFTQAAAVCGGKGIEIAQGQLDIHEIQADTGEPVARDKATKAYKELKQPLVVSDDTWMIPGLKGFPGPYMKYMNDWLSVDDWSRLTQSLADRTIILQQIVVYQDENEQRVFSVNIKGMLLQEARGTSNHPHAALVSFDGGKHSNAEFHEKGQSAAQHFHNVWDDFTEWYAHQRREQ